MAENFGGVRIAVVNPLTIVGRELISILHERGIAYLKIELFDSTGTEKGTLTEIASEPAVVQELLPGALEGLDLVFFCGPHEANQQWIAGAGGEGFRAIDLSERSESAFDGVCVVAGVNEADSDSSSTIVSPHPITVPIVTVLSMLADLPLRLAAVTVTLSASEGGQEGVDEMLAQTIATLNLQSIPKKIFDRQLAFNSYPAPASRSIEQLVVEEVRSILNEKLPISISILQGSAFHGHAFSMFLQFDEEVEAGDLARRISRSDAVLIAEADDLASTVEAAGKDQILIGRIENDGFSRKNCWIWMAVDNTRRSAALNAVLIAEELLARGTTKPN